MSEFEATFLHLSPLHTSSFNHCQKLHIYLLRLHHEKTQKICHLIIILLGRHHYISFLMRIKFSIE